MLLFIFMYLLTLCNRNISDLNSDSTCKIVSYAACLWCCYCTCCCLCVLSFSNIFITKNFHVFIFIPYFVVVVVVVLTLFYRTLCVLNSKLVAIIHTSIVSTSSLDVFEVYKKIPCMHSILYLLCHIIGKHCFLTARFTQIRTHTHSEMYYFLYAAAKLFTNTHTHTHCICRKKNCSSFYLSFMRIFPSTHPICHLICHSNVYDICFILQSSTLLLSSSPSPALSMIY